MKSRVLKKPFNFKLMAMNKMKWDDIRNIAPYGSINDPVVVGLAKAVEKLNSVRHPQVPPTIDRALKAYEIIRALRLSYSSMPRGASEDEVQTPANMILSKLKTGKCTDTVVLYASLLQRLGYSVIITTFNFQKGNEQISHLMLMIDTGLKPEDYRFLHHNNNKLFSFANRLYIPVETTALTTGIQSKASDFLSAWEKGLTQVSQHKQQILNPENTFRLESAWRGGFKSIKSPGIKIYEIPPSNIDRAALNIEELQKSYVQNLLESENEHKILLNNMNDKDINSISKLAHYYFKVRKYYEANKYFEKAVKLSPDNVSSNYYYTATLIYLSLTKDRHIATTLKREARKNLSRQLPKLSRILSNEKLSVYEKWYMNYDLSKWFNRFDDRQRAKIHKQRSDNAWNILDKAKYDYSADIRNSLRSRGFSESSVRLLQTKRITESTVSHLLTQNI
ncbi:MAG: tetratricopeptide repeat protein, partial [Spirochaetota bacterium]|nr:tetratricopeptide repeat protein [Spirochaetota bacterium]